MTNHQIDNLNKWKSAWTWAISLTVILRLGLGIIMALAWLTIKPHLIPTILNIPSPYGKLVVPITSPGDAFLTVWLRWDAVHHLNLALRGYFDLSVGDSVFYPLYALLTRMTAYVVGGNYIVGGLVVSTLATVISFALLFRLAEIAYGSSTAQWSVLVLASYPTAFFLLAPFTESLFLALTLGSFLAAYCQRWKLAGVLGFFASLTRGPGMLMSLALLPIAWRQWKRERFKPIGKRSFFVFLGLTMPAMGGLTFLIWRKSVGFPPISTVLQQYSGLILTNPLSGFVAAVTQWLRYRDFITTFEIATAVMFIFLTGLMIKNRLWRKPEWLIYTLVNLTLFLSKQSFTASSLQSISRYVLILFPVFIALGNWLACQSQRVRFSYLTLSSVFLVLLSVCYSLWIFVG